MKVFLLCFVKSDSSLMTFDRLPGGAGSDPSRLWGRGKDGIHSEQVRHRAYP